MMLIIATLLVTPVIVPTLRVVTPLATLRVVVLTQSVRGYIPTRSVETIIGLIASHL